jgi:hypothetical protein
MAAITAADEDPFLLAAAALESEFAAAAADVAAGDDEPGASAPEPTGTNAVRDDDETVPPPAEVTPPVAAAAPAEEDGTPPSSSEPPRRRPLVVDIDDEDEFDPRAEVKRLEREEQALASELRELDQAQRAEAHALSEKYRRLLYELATNRTREQRVLQVEHDAQQAALVKRRNDMLDQLEDAREAYSLYRDMWAVASREPVSVRGGDTTPPLRGSRLTDDAPPGEGDPPPLRGPRLTDDAPPGEGDPPPGEPPPAPAEPRGLSGVAVRARRVLPGGLNSSGASRLPRS